MAESVRDSIIIPADVDTIMEVIADFEAYPEWQPQIKEAEILATDDDGWGTRVRFVVDAKITRATLVLDYTYTDTSMHWVLVSGDGVRRNDGAYELVDHGDGSTEVTYSLEVEPTVPAPGIIKRQVARGIVDGALKGLRQRVASITTP